MSRLGILLVALLAMFVVCSAAEATVTLEPGGEVRARASDANSIWKSLPFFPSSIPTVPDPASVDAVDGETYSKNLVDFSLLGGQTVLSFDSNFSRNGNRGAGAHFSAASLQFVANETAPYQMSGFLKVADADPSKSGIVIHYARIYDETTGALLFWSEQKSRATHDEQFVLGGTAGDWVSGMEGSLTGTLIAGHRYALQFVSQIETDNFDFPGDADSGASAVGNLTLKIGTVPEPSALALGSIFAVLGLVRRRLGKSC